MVTAVGRGLLEGGRAYSSRGERGWVHKHEMRGKEGGPDRTGGEVQERRRARGGKTRREREVEEGEAIRANKEARLLGK